MWVRRLYIQYYYNLAAQNCIRYILTKKKYLSTYIKVYILPFNISILWIFSFQTVTFFSFAMTEWNKKGSGKASFTDWFNIVNISFCFTNDILNIMRKISKTIFGNTGMNRKPFALISYLINWNKKVVQHI